MFLVLIKLFRLSSHTSTLMQASMSYWWVVLINFANSVVLLSDFLLHSVLWILSLNFEPNLPFWITFGFSETSMIYFKYCFYEYRIHKQTAQSPGIWNVLETLGYESINKIKYTVCTYIYLFLGWFILLYLLIHTQVSLEYFKH